MFVSADRGGISDQWHPAASPFAAGYSVRSTANTPSRRNSSSTPKNSIASFTALGRVPYSLLDQRHLRPLPYVQMLGWSACAQTLVPAAVLSAYTLLCISLLLKHQLGSSGVGTLGSAAASHLIDLRYLQRARTAHSTRLCHGHPRELLVELAVIIVIAGEPSR